MAGVYWLTNLLISLKGEAKGHSKRSQSKESVGGFPSVPRRSVACPANVELKQVSFDAVVERLP